MSPSKRVTLLDGNVDSCWCLRSMEVISFYLFRMAIKSLESTCDCSDLCCSCPWSDNIAPARSAWEFATTLSANCLYSVLSSEWSRDFSRTGRKTALPFLDAYSSCVGCDLCAARAALWLFCSSHYFVWSPWRPSWLLCAWNKGMGKCCTISLGRTILSSSMLVV